MAFWVLNPLHRPGDGDGDGAACVDGAKRKLGSHHGHHADDFYDYHVHKRPGIAPWGAAAAVGGRHQQHDPRHQQQPPLLSHHHLRGAEPDDGLLARDSVPIRNLRNLAFLVIRESPAPSPSPSPEPPAAVASPASAPSLGPGLGPGPGPAPPCAPAMERTESGLSISMSSSPSAHDDALLCSLEAAADDDALASGLLSDLAAARLVRAHLASFRRRCPDSQAERILRALISPKSRGADFPLDNDALRSIFSAANELFFASRLARRVAWDWSHPAAGQYESHIVGTTALRRCARLGGWETLIVLSSPILRDTKYNRRLLISTFLHEMIHSFMFVMCGLKARRCGGHTEGFRYIACLIDEWAGREYLRLGDMEADLERFRGHDAAIAAPFALVPPPLDEATSSSSNNNDITTTMAQPEWRHAHDDRGDYFAEPLLPHQHRAHALGEWQWYEREDFGARGPHASGSPYVY